MPTYSYACNNCGHTFDTQQSFSDATLTQCPECAGDLRKLFNTVGIVFKGSGFYRNDSRAKSSGATPVTPTANKDGGGSKDAGTSSSTTSPTGTESGGRPAGSSPSATPTSTKPKP